MGDLGTHFIIKDEDDIEKQISGLYSHSRIERAPSQPSIAFLTALTGLVLVMLILIDHTTRIWSPEDQQPFVQTDICKRPTIRREWRALSREEQQEYIRAVRCLQTQPSSLGLNSSRYFDFPMAHSRKGENAHESAPFLPWHRLFLHRYEIALKETCEYDGGLVYWDWTLDSSDITTAPVWSPENGFGGNGNRSDQASIDHGYCVTDGPFARMEVPFVFVESQPHCLSRGFIQGSERLRYSKMVTPEVIETLLQTRDYETFNLELEHRAHAAIPGIIQGDFTHFTAPADPVFFLHHTQLDRLWWVWQQRLLPRRHYEYAGQAAYHSNKHASLEDLLDMGGLGENAPVSKLMQTESELLCYKY